MNLRFNESQLLSIHYPLTVAWERAVAGYWSTDQATKKYLLDDLEKRIREVAGTLGFDLVLKPVEAAPQQEEDEAPLFGDGCTCRLEPVHSTMIDPPEPIIDPWCEHHGNRDPDDERDQRIEYEQNKEVVF